MDDALFKLSPIYTSSTLTTLKYIIKGTDKDLYNIKWMLREWQPGSDLYYVSTMAWPIIFHSVWGEMNNNGAFLVLGTFVEINLCNNQLFLLFNKYFEVNLVILKNNVLMCVHEWSSRQTHPVNQVSFVLKNIFHRNTFKLSNNSCTFFIVGSQKGSFFVTPSLLSGREVGSV